MIRINRQPPANTQMLADLTKWRKKAKRVTQQLCACATAKRAALIDYKADVYRHKAFKAYLIWLTHEKCAYCEATVRHVDHGEVEHYRPKKSVQGEIHPGYYWLAFDEKNMLFSCSQCNQREKMTRFPIRGKRVVAPGNLKQELPDLINPYEDDPELELEFVVDSTEKDFAWVRGRTYRGEISKTIYSLNRDRLQRDRDIFLRQFLSHWNALYTDKRRRNELLDLARKIQNGEYEYAAFCRAAIQQFFKDEQRKLQELAAL